MKRLNYALSKDETKTLKERTFKSESNKANRFF